MLVIRVQRYAVVRLVTVVGLMLGLVALASGCNDDPEAGLFQQDGRNLDSVGDDGSEPDTALVVDTSVEVDTVDTSVGVDTVAELDSLEPIDVTDALDGDEVVDSDEPWTEPVGPDCASDDECTGGLKCDELFGTCVECIRPTECGTNARCDRWQCVPTTWCFTDDDCEDSAQGGACKASDLYCIPCYKDWHCDADEICVSGQCKETVACANSLECPGTQICNETGRCIDCVNDADCGDGNRCTPKRVCSPECDSDNDCKDLDMVCNLNKGFCRPPTKQSPPDVVTVTCETHSECGPDYRCRRAGDHKVCMPRQCTDGQMRCANSCRDEGSHCSQAAWVETQVCDPLGGWNRRLCQPQADGVDAAMCEFDPTLESATCFDVVCESAWSTCLTATVQFGCFPPVFSAGTFYSAAVTCNCDDGECIPSPSN